METYKKEEYFEGSFVLKWFVGKDFTEEQKKENEEIPELAGEESGWFVPETKEDWEKAVLCVTDGHEIDCEITDYNEWWDIGMSAELIKFLTDNDYFVEIKVEEDKPVPLTVSKMGRKKMVNIPAKSDIKAGESVFIKKEKKRPK